MSLTSALNSVVSNTGAKFDAGTMKADLASWNAGWPLIFDELSRQQRTVRDWFVPSTVVEISIENPASPTNLQDTIDVLVRTLSAAIAAEATLRITAAQALAMETLYFSVWT